ncbi:hypothetical protein ACTXT7_000348 [Hymenolepis weldensis]
MRRGPHLAVHYRSIIAPLLPNPPSSPSCFLFLRLLLHRPTGYAQKHTGLLCTCVAQSQSQICSALSAHKPLLNCFSPDLSLCPQTALNLTAENRLVRLRYVFLPNSRYQLRGVSIPGCSGKQLFKLRNVSFNAYQFCYKSKITNPFSEWTSTDFPPLSFNTTKSSTAAVGILE